MITVQGNPVLVNHKPWRAICVFAVLATIDVLINAGAGASAARVGASRNGREITPRLVNTGAWMGAIKSSLLVAYEVISVSRTPRSVQIAAYFLTTSLFMTTIFTAFVSLRAIGGGQSLPSPFPTLLVRKSANHHPPVPFKLLLSASLTAPFLVPETIRAIHPRISTPAPADMSRWVWAVFLIPSNAIAGAVFARLAARLAPDLFVGSASAAAAAGAAFGAITFAARAATGIVACVQIHPYWGEGRGVVLDAFGHWEIVVPPPVEVDEEEYLRFLQAGTQATAALLRQVATVADRIVGGLAAASYFVPGVTGADRMRLREATRGWRTGLERNADELSEDAQRV